MGPSAPADRPAWPPDSIREAQHTDGRDSMDVHIAERDVGRWVGSNRDPCHALGPNGSWYERGARSNCLKHSYFRGDQVTLAMSERRFRSDRLVFHDATSGDRKHCCFQDRSVKQLWSRGIHSEARSRNKKESKNKRRKLKKKFKKRQQKKQKMIL